LYDTGILLLLPRDRHAAVTYAVAPSCGQIPRSAGNGTRLRTLLRQGLIDARSADLHAFAQAAQLRTAILLS
jgi:hypothetical protein